MKTVYLIGRGKGKPLTVTVKVIAPSKRKGRGKKYRLVVANEEYATNSLTRILKKIKRELPGTKIKVKLKK
jgi:hypothetical protein